MEQTTCISTISKNNIFSTKIKNPPKYYLPARNKTVMFKMSLHETDQLHKFSQSEASIKNRLLNLLYSPS